MTLVNQTIIRNVEIQIKAVEKSNAFRKSFLGGVGVLSRGKIAAPLARRNRNRLFRGVAQWL